MNATSSGARARRASVLLVGEARTLQSCGMFARTPALASDLFDAIGIVATASASEPIAAAIVPESLLLPPHQHGVESLKMIDPSVRVIGLLSSRDAPPVEKGRVDAWLTLPIHPDELRRALDDNDLVASEATGSSRPATVTDSQARVLEETPAPGHQTNPTEMRASAGAQSPPTSLAAVEIPAPQPSAAASPPPLEANATVRPPPAPELPEQSHESAIPAVMHARNVQPIALPARSSSTPAVNSIGDTDLIEALLAQAGEMQPLALRLIRLHTGWRDVRLTATDSNQHPSAAPAAPIIYSGTTFGRLEAAGACDADLRMWAGWLARWLALEQDFRRFKHAAYTDDLTGACNRRFYHALVTQAIAQARRERRAVTVMVFDIDNFKVYNDRHGHSAGDDILREIVRVLKSIIRQGDCVCRIGGDEFVVVFADPEAPRTPGSRHPESVEAMARRFQQQVCSMRFPKLGVEAPGTLSISAGLATFPWDGADSATLLAHADALALESKRKGKNALTLGRRAGELPPQAHSPSADSE